MTIHKRAFLAAEDAGLLPWKQAISQGNHAFMAGDIDRARASYEMALYTVKRVLASILAEHSEPTDYLDNTLAALVVTEHNLADLLARHGMIALAAEHLCDIHKAMFILIYHHNAKVSSMARRHLQQTHRELTGFAVRHGQQAQITQTLAVTQFICKCCMQKLLH